MRNSELEYLNSVYNNYLNCNNHNKLQNLNGIMNYEHIYLHKISIIIQIKYNNNLKSIIFINKINT